MRRTHGHAEERVQRLPQPVPAKAPRKVAQGRPQRLLATRTCAVTS